jgi:hypothetical protein
MILNPPTSMEFRKTCPIKLSCKKCGEIVYTYHPSVEYCTQCALEVKSSRYVDWILQEIQFREKYFTKKELLDKTIQELSLKHHYALPLTSQYATGYKSKKNIGDRALPKPYDPWEDDGPSEYELEALKRLENYKKERS